MRCTYLGLAATILSLADASRLSNLKAGVGHHVDTVLAAGHRILTDTGSHRKNSSSISAQRASGKVIADYSRLELRQAGAGGRCGPDGGNARCGDDLCCSDYGYCGDSVDHCAPLFDCQPQFGVCGWPRAPPPPPTTAPPPPPTTTAPPPPPTTTSVPPVIVTSITSLPRPPTTTQVVPPPVQTVLPGRVTTNGQCGNGTMCIGNPNYGPCCSQFFWCGSSIDFCGAGCQSNFGACLGVPGQPPNPVTNGTALPPTVPPTTVIQPPTTIVQPPTTIVQPPTTTAPPPPPTTTTTARPTTTAGPALPPGMRSSTDGRCGTGVSCIGSQFGRCCSQFGFCGDGDQYCPPIVGCQPEFGICDP